MSFGDHYSYDRRQVRATEDYAREAKAALEKLIHTLNQVWTTNYEVHEAIERAIRFGNLDPKKKKAYEEALERIYEAGTLSSGFYKYMAAVGKASKL